MSSEVQTSFCNNFVTTCSYFVHTFRVDIIEKKSEFCNGINSYIRYSARFTKNFAINRIIVTDLRR